MDLKLYRDWYGPSKKVTFEDDLEVKLKYSCTYRIYDWDGLKPEIQKESLEAIKDINKKKVFRTQYEVEVNCEFEDYVPIARGIDPEEFDTITDIEHVAGIAKYKIDVEPAVAIKQWMLEGDLDRYFEWQYEQKNEDTRDRSVPFLKGFLTRFREYTDPQLDGISYEELDVEVKKRVKDLVAYFVAPRLKLVENLHGTNFFGSSERIRNNFFVPENYLKLEHQREIMKYERSDRSRTKESDFNSD